MANEYAVNSADLTSVADAIREKGGTANPLSFPAGFVDAIQNMKGGGGLNFEIVGGTTQPENPAENTIWISTDVTIDGYAFSDVEPEIPSAGMVWVKTGTTGVTTINATEENAIMLNVCECAQYLDGAWVKMEACVYQGEWIDLRQYLFKRGHDFTEVTGGINGTVQDDALYVSATISKSDNKTYTTKQSIDLTNINTIHMTVYSEATDVSVYVRATATKSAYNGSNVQTSNLGAYSVTNAPFTSPKSEMTLDVSGLSGKYYLGYAWGVLSSSTASSRSVTGYVYEWWVD